jgi:histidine ammonia-lyase
MGSNAATKSARVADNTERVLAIELFNSAQAFEFRLKLAAEVAGREVRSSKAIEGLFADFRKVVPFVDDDTLMYPLIAKAVKFLQEN